MNYNNFIPKFLDSYIQTDIIKNIKKINYDKNLLIYGKSGYGKTHIKNIIINKYKNDNPLLKIINIDIQEDFKKTNNISCYINNILILKQHKLFVLDNIDKIEIDQQLYIKSLIKNYKNINFLIFLNDISTLIENFDSLFIILKLDHNYFELNKKKILTDIKNNISFKLSKTNFDYIISKSNNFYDLKKKCIFFLLFKDKSSVFLSSFKSITLNNDNKILKKLISNDLNYNIKYINQLLQNGYSENNIINFLINSIKNDDINIKNRNTIINIILELEMDRVNYTYIDLLYIIKNLSI